MRTYEITYITLTEEGSNAESIRETLGTHKATIVSVNPWAGRRKFAYPINKQDQGFYTTVVFDAEPATLKAIDKELRMNESILRTLIVHFTPGLFQRVAETTPETAKPTEAKTPEAPKAVETITVEEKVEDAPVEAIAQTPVTETAEAEKEVKPKRAPKKATAEDTKNLDETLDKLLSEDIAQ